MSIKDDMKKRLGARTDKTEIDANAIRALSELLNETGLTEIEIEQNGARIRVSRAGVMAAAPAVLAAVPTAAPAPSTPAGVAHPGAVPSPMVGTVFLAPGPGKPAFVSTGTVVKEGDTLFIVEAMKTMNAITAPRAGTVLEVLVQDGQPVEFGQMLIVIG